jgi:hypothetical protein
VLLTEMSDRRVRSIGDLRLDVPVLAVLNTWQPARQPLLGHLGASRALPHPG